MASSKKKKDIWKLEGVQAFADGLINEGILKRKEGLQKLCDALNKNFAEALGRRKFSPRIVEDRVVWNKRDDAFLKHFVSRDLGLEEVYERFKDTRTKEMIDRRAKKHKGHSAARRKHEASGPGVGRVLVSSEIVSLKEAERILPDITPAKPYPVKVANPKRFSIMTISGPSIGLLYSKVMDENPLRCALRESHLADDDIVHITGGLMFLDVKKSQGHLTTHRALLSGINYDGTVMDSDYADLPELGSNAVHDAQPADKVVFETLRERALNLMHGFKNITTDEDGKPLTKAKVLVEFGVNEEEFIEAIAHSEVLYITFKMRDECTKKIETYRALLRYELKMSKGKETAESKRLVAEIDKWRKIEKRMIQSNVSAEDRKRFTASARAWLIRQFEENIPNSKVIAQGTTHVRMGEQTIAIRQDRSINATENALDKFLREKAGPMSLDGSLPNLVLLANPFMVNFRWSAREHGSQTNRKTAWIAQLPVALDKDFLSDAASTMIRKVSQPERVLRHERFEPGVMRFRYTDGIWSHARLSIGHIKHAFEVKRSPKLPKKPERYVYVKVHTDDHTGDPWHEEYWDPRLQQWVGHASAFMRMMVDAYRPKRRLIPFHAYFCLDDETQGHHFPTQSQPHEYVEPFQVIQERFARIRERAKAADTPAAAFKALDELQEKALGQLRFRGSHWPQTQVEEFCDRIIHPNAEFYSQILQRSLAGKVRIEAPSELAGVDSDTRDAALIIYFSGNHFGSTVNNELTEGFIYRRELLGVLRRDKNLKGVPLERLVQNPLHGNTPVGWGRLIAGADGYPWGLSLRTNPSRKSGANGDPLDQAAKNVMERGDFTRIFGEGKITIHLSGDIHRFGQVSLEQAEVVNCAPCKDTDPYGHRGFSPNHIGTLALGMPAKGPDYGPIRVIPFNHTFMRNYLLEPWQVDWDSIFANPV